MTDSEYKTELNMTRIESLLEQIKRENAEHAARLMARENSQTKWIIAALLAFCGITATIVGFIIRPL